MKPMLKFIYLLTLSIIILSLSCEKESTEPGSVNQSPGVPYNPYPEDGATNQSVSLTLTWQCVDPDGDLLNYDVHFGTNNNPPLVNTSRNTNSYQADNLDNSTTYYLRIVARDGYGATASSPIWSFVTVEEGLSPPSAPFNPNPTNNSEEQSLTTILNWSCTDPDGDPLTYDVYFGLNSMPSLVSSDQQNATYEPPGILDYETTYYWRIVAKDGIHETSGVIWSFNTTSSIGKIAFISYRDGNSEVYIMNANGTNQHNISNNDSLDRYPSWSPDWTKIAFASNRHGNWEIYTMNIDGTNQQRITFNPSEDYFTSWSPDGTKITFYSNRDGNWQIYVMNADGSNQQRITNNNFDDSFPSWSPDGENIAFHSGRDGSAEIYVMNTDGTNQQRITFNNGENSFPSWSPDGTEIAFLSYRDGNPEVYVMNADGTNQHNISNNAFFDRYPSWSLDGSKIAFESNRDGNWEIYVMNADGTDQQNITNNIGIDDNPAWSPR